MEKWKYWRAYNSFDGVLYCKPHFDQLFKMSGSPDKSLKVLQKWQGKDPLISKVSRLFAGTQVKCVACNKTVYPLEKVAVDGTSCFKCSHGVSTNFSA